MSKATIISDKCKLSSAMERRQTLGLRGWSAHHLHDRSHSLHGPPEVADFQHQRRRHRPHQPLPAPAQVSLVSLVLFTTGIKFFSPAFKCRAEGFFPHATSCKKYFWCLDTPNQGMVAHTFSCPQVDLAIWWTLHLDITHLITRGCSSMSSRTDVTS